MGTNRAIVNSPRIERATRTTVVLLKRAESGGGRNPRTAPSDSPRLPRYFMVNQRIGVPASREITPLSGLGSGKR